MSRGGSGEIVGGIIPARWGKCARSGTAFRAVMEETRARVPGPRDPPRPGMRVALTTAAAPGISRARPDRGAEIDGRYEASTASSTSLRALDAVNVFLADVRDGLGPYLAIYLTMRHWDPGRIGIAMSAMGIATVAAQTPAGAFIDRTRHKRLAIAAAAVAVAVGAVAMVLRPTFPMILAAQVLMGASSAIFGPAIAAITLGLVGHACLSRRTGRNEAYNHAGNVAAAVLAMVIGDHIAYEGIFYLLAGMCIATIVATWFIRPRGDRRRARPGAAAPRSPRRSRAASASSDRWRPIGIARTSRIGELFATGAS